MLVWLQAVEQGFESLLREYNQVRDDVAQGLGFYGQLQEAVKTLHQEVGDYCLARSLPPAISSSSLPGIVVLTRQDMLHVQTLTLRTCIVLKSQKPGRFSGHLLCLEGVLTLKAMLDG